MIIETINPDVARRFRGHERTVQEGYSLAKEEAHARRLALLRLRI
jgi:hypothetical protein